MFVLSPQLAMDTVTLGQFPLSLVLLSKDANYPWCILVPQRQHIREMHQLGRDDRVQLLEESCVLAEVMEGLFHPVKMNVAALGNVVPQLHIHHIARFDDDPSWPKPIWGVVEAKACSDTLLDKRVCEAREGILKSTLAFRV